MATVQTVKRLRRRIEAALLLLMGLVATCTVSGCLMVGGSSRGGFFIFPGSVGLIVIIAIVALVLRRR